MRCTVHDVHCTKTIYYILCTATHNILYITIFSILLIVYCSPASAVKDMQRFEIGVLDDKGRKPQKQLEFENAYRELRAKLMAAGLFTANKWYYVYKVVSNLVLLGISVACVLKSESFGVHMLGAFFLAL